MTTARYIVSNVNAANGSFLDLGIQGRGLTDTGAARDITYVDSEATTPAAIQRVYYRAGMSLNMAASTVSGSNYVVYLDGASTDYTINAATGTITLTSDTTQVLTVRVEAATTVVFSDGQLAGNALGSAVSGNGSLSYSGTAGAAQNLRILTGDSAGEAFAIARSGTTVTAGGHRGVDALYVEAGGAADATRLGGGKDVVYLTSNFADYNLSVRGLTLVLQHSTNASETVYLAMGVAGAATDDRVVFANGAVDSSEIREAYLNNAGGANSFTGISTLADISTQSGRAVSSVDTAVTTALYTPATPAAPTLTTDTAAASAVNTDGVTSNGAISAGARAANADVTDVLQYSVNGGAFQNVPAGGLTLAGQVSGATGITYAAGAVQYRSVSASGVVSAVSSNAAAITVDTATSIATSVFDNTTTIAPGSMRYITLWQTAAQAINLAELKLYDANGTLINLTALADANIVTSTNLQNPTGTAAQQLGWWDATHQGAKLFDGSANQNHTSNNTIHTSALTTTPTYGAIFIDLGQTYTVSRMELLNRVESGAALANRAKDMVILTSANEMASAFTAAAGGQVAYDAMRVGAAVNRWALAVDANSYDVRAVTTNSTQYSSTNPMITGTGEAGATVSVTVTETGQAAAFSGTTTVLANGTWSITTTVAPAAVTTYTISVQQTDAAGNTMAAAVTSTMIIDPSIPSTPTLAAASNSGVLTDVTTNDSTPTIAGTARAGQVVTILVDGVAVSPTTTADAVTGAWSYTLGTPLLAGDHTIAARSDGKESANLTVTIDLVSSAPVISVPSVMPTMVTTASGDLVLSGTLESGSTAATVTLTDSASASDANAATITQNGDGTTSWTVTFTAAELAALADGTVTLSIASTDVAGNPGALAVNPTFTLELVNSAPVANSGMTNASLARVISTSATGTILDLLDTDANAATTGTVDDAFTDADAVGSVNGTVTYSGQLITSLGADAAVGGGDDVYGALPSWLEVTAAGVVQVVSGQVPLAGVYNLHLTATDGAATPLSATRDVQLTVSAGVALNTALGINQATVATVSDFDLRSDIVFTATGNLTAVTGNSITLHNQADGAVTTGDIVIDAANAAVALSYNAGTDTTSIRINPGFDLDANATYTLSVAAGAFTNASSGASLAFSTVFASVNPNGGDNIAEQFAAGASVLSDSATWVDITADGNGVTSTLGVARDVSTGANVLYAGAATVNGANSFDVNANYYASVTGFGADDVLYFDDQANGANYGLVTNFDTALTFLQSDSTGSTIAAAPDRNSLSMSGVDGLNQAPTLLVQLAGATTMATSVHGVGAGTMETLLGVTPAAVMVA